MRGIISPASFLAVTLAVCATTSPTRAQTFEGAMAGWLGSIQRWVSSIRVDTRQSSLATEQQANAGQAAAMALANVIVEQEAAINIRAAVARYESMANDEVTGLCAPAAAQESANSAAATAEELADEFAQFEREWLGEGGSRIETMIATHRLRRTVLCTAAEAAQGLCESGAEGFGVTPAGDSDAGPFLTRRSYGSAEVEMGSLYVDTLAPLPTIQSADEAVSVDELLARGEARRQAALVSLARAGLSDVLLRGLQSEVVE